MGNTSTQETDSTFCQFNFLSQKTLTQSSLKPPGLRKSMTAPTEHESRSPKLEPKLERKDCPDAPDSKEGLNLSPFSQRKHTQTLTENDFHIMKVLGAQDCGRVYVVKKEDDQKLYTMKTINKRKAYSLGCVDSICFEKEILTKANHPFLPRLEYTFENDRKIFLIFDYVESEELSTILRHLTRFSEEITKFYSAEILLALEYLHHDIKASYNLNTKDILFDSEGHIKLGNFSHSRNLDMGVATKSEVCKRKMIDFRDFGYLVYEFLTGKKVSDENEQKALERSSVKNKLFWPKYISKGARDLITRLVNPKVEERLGYNSFDEIKCHPFFEGIQWRKLQKKLVYPPINLACHKETLKKDEEEVADFSHSSGDSCELEEIILKRPKDIMPDTSRGESYDHHFPSFNRLED